MVEKRWAALEWQLPTSALKKCWWLTNPQQHKSPEAPPHFLCKSITILRAEQHRLRVASLGKLREELQRRWECNRQARSCLEENSEWRRRAKEPQAAWTRRPTSTNLAALTTSTYQPSVLFPHLSSEHMFGVSLFSFPPHALGPSHSHCLRGVCTVCQKGRNTVRRNRTFLVARGAGSLFDCNRSSVYEQSCACWPTRLVLFVIIFAGGVGLGYTEILEVGDSVR